MLLPGREVLGKQYSAVHEEESQVAPGSVAFAGGGAVCSVICQRMSPSRMSTTPCAMTWAVPLAGMAHRALARTRSQVALADTEASAATIRTARHRRSSPPSSSPRSDRLSASVTRHNSLLNSPLTRVHRQKSTLAVPLNRDVSGTAGRTMGHPLERSRHPARARCLLRRCSWDDKLIGLIVCGETGGLARGKTLYNCRRMASILALVATRRIRSAERSVARQTIDRPKCRRFAGEATISGSRIRCGNKGTKQGRGTAKHYGWGLPAPPRHCARKSDLADECQVVIATTRIGNGSSAVGGHADSVNSATEPRRRRPTPRCRRRLSHCRVTAAVDVAERNRATVRARGSDATVTRACSVSVACVIPAEKVANQAHRNTPRFDSAVRVESSPVAATSTRLIATSPRFMKHATIVPGCCQCSRLTRMDQSAVPPAGFEPAIFTLKG